MATRSVIMVGDNLKSRDGTYCHWDGYPEHNGKQIWSTFKHLKKHYSPSNAAQVLKDFIHNQGNKGIRATAPTLDKWETYQKDKNTPSGHGLSYSIYDEEYGYLISNDGRWFTVMNNHTGNQHKFDLQGSEPDWKSMVQVGQASVLEDAKEEKFEPVGKSKEDRLEEIKGQLFDLTYSRDPGAKEQAQELKKKFKELSGREWRGSKEIYGGYGINELQLN